MLRILESQAPAKQTAADTINTLSSRLSSATLLEDRRAAILGLRSFAKRFPASVASAALRDLLSALRKDGEDSETTKIVLETLLMLFEPDENSPEASEEITLWLADEFTQRQDNITALLDLLETGEFYLRLYSIQILSHVCAARPQRTHEAVLAAPLGVPRIAAVLDERREAVRNEALLLLIALTPDSVELQKMVAFENVFEKVFALVESEGGLTHGSTIVQDCLSLLANLLTLNPANQSYFRESGCILRVSKLLQDAVHEEEIPEGVAEWTRSQRDMNLWGLLAVIQLFLAYGSQGTAQAQIAFQQNKVLLRILQIAFHNSFGRNVRSKSLDACGDIIRGNSRSQEQFGDLAVPLIREDKSVSTNGHTGTAKEKAADQKSLTPVPTTPTNVIEALLELILEPAPASLFDVRLSACNCMKAFIEGHKGIRGHVLHRAIEGHNSGTDTIPNILTVLLETPSARSYSDPYQVWMASVLLMHLLWEDQNTRSMAAKITEGNAEDGEEVVTFIQSVTSNIIGGVQHTEDERALLGQLMLLTTWLYESPEAVNDLLGEGSNVQGLIAAVKVASASMPLVAGLCALLLGIVYEFSTKDSPIPRPTLHGVLIKNMTREVYIDRLTKLRESPFVRDFEVMSTSSSGGLPEVYFDKPFMDFLKDNFSRLLRAVDRDPNFEVSIVSEGVQKGISRELVDTLRADLTETQQSLQTAQTELLQLRQKIEQEELDHRRTRESATVELKRIKQINESLQRNYDEESLQSQHGFSRQLDSMAKEHDSKIAQIRREHVAAMDEIAHRHQAEKNYLEQRQSGHERDLVRTRDMLSNQHKKEIECLNEEAAEARLQLTTRLEMVNKSLEAARQAQTNQGAQLQAMRDELKESQLLATQTESELTSRLRDLKGAHTADLQALEARLEKAEQRARSAEARAKTAEDRLAAAEDQAKAAEAASTQGAARSSAKFESQVNELKKELDALRPAAAKAKDIQTELDDLLVVFADLEVKRAGDKTRLKGLGEEVSEDEDDGGEDDDDDEDEEVD